MKKIISFIAIISILVSTVGTTFATTKTEGIYYKTIAVTNMKIESAFRKDGKKIVSYLEKTFLQLRADKNTKRLSEITNKVKPILESLQKKTSLSRKEKKIKMLAENIYARSSILKDYLLK